MSELGKLRQRIGAVLPRWPHAATLVPANALVAVAYWLVAVGVKWYFSQYQMWPAPIWLPAGVSLFAVIAIGRWSWPGILLGSWLTNSLSFGETAFWGAVIAAGNTLAPVLAIELARFARKENPLARTSDVLRMGMAALASGVISGGVGAIYTWWRRGEPGAVLTGQWFSWTLSDTGGAQLIVPLLLSVRRWRTAWERVRRHPGEFFLFSAALTATVVYLLKGKTGVPAADAGASFLVLVPLVWLAVRFSVPTAYPMFVGVMSIVVAGTLAGYGPYAGIDRGGTCFIFAQMAVGFGAALLLLGAASEEQRTTETALRELNEELESRVEQRTAELRESKEQMEKAALHDALTGLPNRRFLEQRFSACRSAAARKRTGLAVLLIDLDHFKQINDSIGHDAGDVILTETGRRLSAAVREYDVVARMGGDEFAVLLPDIEDEAGVESVCARIVRTLTDRIFFNGRQIVTSPSIGVALYPQHGDLWQDLYKAADTALYQAKRAGRCRWEWYQPEEAAAVGAN